MLYKRNASKNYRGMRSGISLVEMMIAVILFGVISVVGLKYYKNYYCFIDYFWLGVRNILFVAK